MVAASLADSGQVLEEISLAGQGESKGKGSAKVKGRRGRDRKQKRKDRGEQGQHVKSYGRPCMEWGKTRGQQGGHPQMQKENWDDLILYKT